MTETDHVKNIGLRGVTVADTRISHVDGTNGILIYRGYRIEDLAMHSTFEETAYLLLHDWLPSADQLEGFKKLLTEARDVSGFVFESLKLLTKGACPMDVLQAAVPLLAMADAELETETREANIDMAVRLISRISSLVAGWDRIRKGLAPVAPDRLLSHTENFLWQLTGMQPDPDVARDLDTILVFSMQTIPSMHQRLRAARWLPPARTCTRQSQQVSGHFQAAFTAALTHR